jgi:galactokinase/mevalonate kinase-like predicted kinase
MSPSPNAFPFDHVVITFPDAAAARTAAEGPMRRVLQPAYPQVRFTATSDPFDARVGSGGGTAAALLDHAGDPTETVLVLHAGGAASRCPTQMCLGKAWTSLPVSVSHTEQPLPTPLDIWMQLCQELFVGLPSGSLVVIASDTLLQLEEGSAVSFHESGGGMVDWMAALANASTIVGLAVPAPLVTAANHGVFVLSPHNDDNTKNATLASIRPCRSVLQKPSIKAMQLRDGCCFARHSDPCESCAWIDTGVTIFSPRAAATVVDTARTRLPRCTATGLRALYETTTHADDTITLPEFATQQALSVDLYTHVLQALSMSEESCESQQARKDVFLSQYSKELSEAIAVALWEAFSPVLLQVLVVPTGRFWHLGTTRELRGFLVDACDRTGGTASEFGARLGLSRRVRAYTVLGGTYQGGSNVDPTAVIFDSILSVCSDGSKPTGGVTNDSISYSSIGARTVIIDETIRIGKNCLVSGLRLPLDPKGRGDIVIPDDMVVQMVRLSNALQETEEAVVIIALSINDEIKKRCSLYGVSVEAFLRRSGLTDQDVWDDLNPSRRTIWNAKLHPIVALSRNESFATVFSWLRIFDSDGLSCDDDALEKDVSFIRWKSSRRLALSEIRDISDAPYEFQFREALIKHRFPHFRTIYNERLAAMLRERQQVVPVDFQFLVDGYVNCTDVNEKSIPTIILLEILHAVDDVIRDCMNRDGSHDIGSRACMLESNLLDDIVGSLSSLQSTEKLEDIAHRTNGDPFRDFNSLVSLRDESITVGRIEVMAKAAELLQELAGSLTGRHVLAARGMQLSLQSQPPVRDRWVVAAAPARIDLSGGWSDTPPICYEFGSLVVGMAVLIDDRKPLMCRCRIVSGGTGILLRTETRCSTTGDLISKLEKEIRSMDGFMDYRNPAIDCALLMCALDHLGLAMNDEMDFQTKVNMFCRSENVSVRLEVIATTTLPQGSGLGSSSILAGCILAAVGKCVGSGNKSSTEYVHEIVDSVLNVEQYLTTGGGFQDQVNGLVGGIKAVSSSPNVFPMKVSIEVLSTAKDFRLELEARMFLLFTGKTRLAKNLLTQVLTRWSKQTPEIINAVSGLVHGAKKCRDSIASGSVDLLGECLSEYWTYKKVMAGPSSGVEPNIITDVIRCLSCQGLIKGASLCGAGGGGFMILLGSSGVLESDLKQALSNDPNVQNEAIASFSWHACKLCDEGLVVRTLENANGKADEFDVEWLSN